MKELVVQNRILLALGRLPGSRVFRNAVGRGWVGTPSRALQERMRAEGLRPIKFGLAPGTPDIIGWCPMTITPEMVGRTLPVFGGIEVKGPRGRLQANQETCRDLMLDHGCVWGVARTTAEARAIWGVE